MQLLTAAPRGTLTAAQVTELLTGASSVAYDRGLEILDNTLAVVEDISGDFEGGTVTRTMAATIHGTCQLTIARDVDYGTQLLRPYLLLSAGGVTARFNGGVFVPTKPATGYGPSILSNVINGSDRLLQLNRPVGDAHTVDADAGYLTAIKAVFALAGIDPSQVLLDSTAAALTLPASRSWPLLVNTSTTDVQPIDTVADSNSATTFLRIINDLLAAIGYRGVWVDQDGFFRSEPYLTPAQRAVEFPMDFDDPNRAIVATDRTVSRDISQVPNEWIFQQQNLPTDTGGNAVEPTEGAGQYTVRNQSAGDTSIDARGGDPLGVYSVVVQLDAADQTTLESLGDQRVTADENVSRTYAVATSPFPVAGHFDIYTYSDDELGGQVKVMGTAWTLDYGTSKTPPADMTHTWQQVA